MAFVIARHELKRAQMALDVSICCKAKTVKLDIIRLGCPVLQQLEEPETSSLRAWQVYGRCFAQRIGRKTGMATHSEPMGAVMPRRRYKTWSGRLDGGPREPAPVRSTYVFGNYTTNAL